MNFTIISLLLSQYSHQSTHSVNDVLHLYYLHEKACLSFDLKFLILSLHITLVPRSHELNVTSTILFIPITSESKLHLNFIETLLFLCFYSDLDIITSISLKKISSKDWYVVKAFIRTGKYLQISLETTLLSAFPDERVTTMKTT